MAAQGRRQNARSSANRGFQLTRRAKKRNISPVCRCAQKTKKDRPIVVGDGSYSLNFARDPMACLLLSIPPSFFSRTAENVVRLVLDRRLCLSSSMPRNSKSAPGVSHWNSIAFCGHTYRAMRLRDERYRHIVPFYSLETYCLESWLQQLEYKDDMK